MWGKAKALAKTSERWFLRGLVACGDDHNNFHIHIYRWLCRYEWSRYELICGGYEDWET